jgi:hypothetical protein
MPLKLAIVGRPNVGKSRLFNRLAGRTAAIVHDTPGVTRDRQAVDAEYDGLALRLIDTAGFEESFRLATGWSFFVGAAARVGLVAFRERDAGLSFLFSPVTTAPSCIVSFASFLASFSRRSFNRFIFLMRFLRFFIGGTGLPIRAVRRMPPS